MSGARYFLPVREHLRPKPRRDLLASVPSKARGKAAALPIEGQA